MRFKDFSHNQSGLSTLELLCVVAIVAVIAAFASRGATAALHAARSNSALSDLLASLTRARSLAANAEEDIVLCPSADGETCSSGYHWEYGWIAFPSKHAGSDRLPDEPILIRQMALQRSVHLITTRGRTRVRFQANGSNAGSNATFTICDGRGPRSATAYAMSNPGNLRSIPPDPENVANACANL